MSRSPRNSASEASSSKYLTPMAKPSTVPPLSLQIPVRAPGGLSRPTPTKCTSPRRSPVTPRTRNRRRRGQIFDGSSRGSSVYSFQSVNSVKSRWWTTYQPIQSFGSAISSPSSSSPGKKLKKVPQPLAQPFLYRMLSVPGGSTTPQPSIVRVNSAARLPRSHRTRTPSTRDPSKGGQLAGENEKDMEVAENREDTTAENESDDENLNDAQFTMAIAITTDDIIIHRHAPVPRYPDIQKSPLPTIRIVSPISFSVFS